MKIEVTQKHIDNGRRSNGCLCPVALAITQTLKKINLISVTEDRIQWEKGKRFVELFTPDAVGDFISNFDDGKPVEPFAFELEF